MCGRLGRRRGCDKQVRREQGRLEDKAEAGKQMA